MDDGISLNSMSHPDGLIEEIADAIRRGKLRLDCSGCWRCLRERGVLRQRMLLCPKCGNKRCPKAADHDFACTGSNEPGQPGSVY